MGAILEKLGFLESEEDIYEALLGQGTSTASELADITGYDRTTVYKALDSLIDSGLVSYIIKSNKKKYEATDPERIKIMIEEEKEELEEAKEDLKGLKKKFEEKAERVTTQVYEGVKGAKTLWEKLYRKVEEGDPYLIAGAPQSSEKIGGYFKDLAERLVEKGANVRALYNKDATGLAETKEDIEGFNVRFMPEEYITPVSIEVIKDTTALTIYKPKTVIFAITNHRVADSFRNYFDMLWKIAGQEG